MEESQTSKACSSGSTKKLCAASSLPYVSSNSATNMGNPFLTSRQTSLPISVSPTKQILSRRKSPPPPFLRLNSDPKILPSTEESRQLEVFSGGSFEEANDNCVGKLRSQLESGSVKCGQFLDPNQRILQQNNSDTKKQQVKMLVKQKSLGRTLSTSVLRIKKKRSFWSSEKFKQ